jgi:hypothetical protein
VPEKEMTKILQQHVPETLPSLNVGMLPQAARRAQPGAHDKTSMLKVKKVMVVTSYDVDRILITFDAPSTFPGLGVTPSAQLEARPGYGASWCKEVLGNSVVIEVIDARHRRK